MIIPLEAAEPESPTWQEVSKKSAAFVELGDDADIAIRQAKEGGGYLIVSNVDGVLSVMQIAADGSAPVNVKILGDDKAEISVKRPSVRSKFLPLIIDNDGDGIPDEKVDLNEAGELVRYKLESIKWLATPGKPKVEQAGAGQPATRSESDSEGDEQPQPESEGSSR